MNEERDYDSIGPRATGLRTVIGLLSSLAVVGLITWIMTGYVVEYRQMERKAEKGPDVRMAASQGTYPLDCWIGWRGDDYRQLEPLPELKIVPLDDNEKEKWEKGRREIAIAELEVERAKDQLSEMRYRQRDLNQSISEVRGVTVKMVSNTGNVFDMPGEISEDGKFIMNRRGNQ